MLQSNIFSINFIKIYIVPEIKMPILIATSNEGSVLKLQIIYCDKQKTYSAATSSNGIVE